MARIFSYTNQNFMLLLTAGILLVIIAGFYAANLAIKNVDTQIRGTERLSVELASGFLKEELSTAVGHMRSLAVYEGNDSDDQTITREQRYPEIERAFRTLLLRNPEYLRVRWLDEAGRELVRVDRFSVSDVHSVDTSDIKESVALLPETPLGQDQMQLSLTNLSEKPFEAQASYKPFVQLKNRLFTADGQPLGYFILNIGISDYLAQMLRFATPSGLWLFTQSGEALYALTPDGAEVPDTDYLAVHPLGSKKAQDILKTAPLGQQETTVGLWTWASVTPKSDGFSLEDTVGLKVAALSLHANVQDQRFAQIIPIILLAFVFLLLYGIGLYRLLREMHHRRNAEKSALEASKAKSSFLAAMSHEIRTPMTGIIGLANMLADDKLEPESRSKVKRIREAADALLVILNDILDLSKLDAGKFLIESQPFRPLDLTNDVVHLFYMTCPPDKKSRLQVTAKVEGDIPSVLWADHVRVRQILVNLVNNAIKFTDVGHVIVTCSFDAVTQELRFDVTDTGIGMDEATVSKLFENFMQADASISRKYQGTGLGLAVSKQLVDCMGGHIHVESTLGEGSHFFFTIPCKVGADTDLPSEQNLALPIEDRDGKTLSILVAEDNEINQMIVHAMLKKMGHNCSFAANGQQAIDMVQREDYDLILMDVRMPGVSGPDATRAIRQMPEPKNAVPIIALTADLIADNKSEYFAAGMNDCVGKPINPEELATAISIATGGGFPS